MIDLYIQKFIKNKYNVIYSFTIALIASVILNFIGITFSEYSYYYTLSSIFQGLFSIMALAGIFVIFKTEQLSKDIVKYDNDIRDRLLLLRRFMGDDLYNLLKNHLEFREVEKFKNAFQELKEKMESADNKDLLSAKELCEHKIDLIGKNREFISEILTLFKLPFLVGMFVIIFSIYFLPMLNSTSSDFPFQIPIYFIVGIAVFLTIIVIVEIACVIYFTFWSEIAKKTL